MRSFVAAISAFVCLWSTLAAACTGIQIIAKDGSVVYARTMEFGKVLPPLLVAIPQNATVTALGMNGKPGLTWQAKYASVGLGLQGYSEVIADGLNEAGLGTGIFYHPGCAEYDTPKPSDQSNTISVVQLPTFLLGTCANVADAMAALERVFVAPITIPEFGGPPPMHLIVHDRTGRSIVIEFLQGKTKVFENPVGVITNSPTFDWHLTNLRNYINLSPKNSPPLVIGQARFPQFGEGSGMHGLPGDYTPPSRFVRAVAFSQNATPPSDGLDAVNTAFHILDNFDIVKGTVRAEDAGRAANDYTQWTSAADLKNSRYYYRTYANPQIRFIDLNSLDFGSGKILNRPIKDVRPTLEDETSKFKKS